MLDNQLNTNVKKVMRFDICNWLVISKLYTFVVKFLIDTFFGRVVEVAYLCDIRFNF